MNPDSDPIERGARLEASGQLHAAFRLYLRAARSGNSDVFLNLGGAYDLGRGIRRCRSKALHWYRRAYADGQASGANNIATVYRDQGDTLRAIRWCERAVAMGDEGANILLGQLWLVALCFRSVGPNECAADIEASRVWAAVAEGMLATRGEDNERPGEGRRTMR
jgi:tetratricopeptide (TPR) repeat protein